ncbi:sporulation protein YunB [Porcipelethomonas sp.]|uniref:sporulation protein YunB n=1 Tax=Porcipelethomonas sp. TaxID=2981675 RepID=UPI003EF8C7B1
MLFAIFNIERAIKPKAEKISKYYCEVFMSDIINQSVYKILEENSVKYSDLASEIYDDSNKLTSIKINSGNINSLQSEITAEINRKLNEESRNSVSIPLGTVGGTYIFSGRGPEIEIKFIPAGSVQTELKSGFFSAGMNQTCHQISMDIKAEISAVFPGGSSDTQVNLNCILAETVIVGDIPKGIIGEV